MGPEAIGGGLGILVLAVVVICALAPFILAVKARSVVAICVAVATTGAALVILLASKTAADGALAAILWLGGLLTAAICNGAAEIVAALNTRATALHDRLAEQTDALRGVLQSRSAPLPIAPRQPERREAAAGFREGDPWREHEGPKAVDRFQHGSREARHLSDGTVAVLGNRGWQRYSSVQAADLRDPIRRAGDDR